MAPDQESIYALWNALADYPAARTGDALMRLFAFLQPLVGAQNVFWCLLLHVGSGEAERTDPCRGWRLRDTVIADPTPERLERIHRFQQGTDKESALHAGMTTVALMRGSGRFRAPRMRDGMVDWEAFQRTAHYKIYYETPGINDRMWVTCPINADTESCFVFDRIHAPANFSEADAGMAETVLRGIRWFHRRLSLSRGIPVARTPCTPTERRVLGLLLTGSAEKEIADELGLGVGTAHNHVGRIFRKFGVRSRAELMALWL